MLPLLLLLFIAVPIAELYVLIQVGEAIGALPTIALLIADSLLGGWLVRHQGRQAWRRLRAALAAGRVPAREAIDGALVLLGGALLVTPGFLSDVLGLVLLVPPARALVRRMAERHFARRALGRLGRFALFGGFGRRRGGGRRPGRGYDVDGTAYEVAPGPLGR